MGICYVPSLESAIPLFQMEAPRLRKGLGFQCHPQRCPGHTQPAGVGGVVDPVLEPTLVTAMSPLSRAACCGGWTPCPASGSSELPSFSPSLGRGGREEGRAELLGAPGGVGAQQGRQ